MNLAKEQIAKQFSRAASTYDSVAQLQVSMARHLLSQVPDDCQGHWVDLGCGTGWALEQAKSWGRFQLTGVDIAPGMIEVAGRRIADAKLICADLEQTPLANDSADILFSSAAIQWCDLDAAVKEMSRILSPGGRLLLSTFGPQTLKQWKSAWQSLGDSERVHEFDSVEKIMAAIQKFDFLDPQLEVVLHQSEFESVDEMFDSIKRLGATNAQANRPSGMLGRKKYEQLRAIFENQLRETGILTLTFECIFVSAGKRDDAEQKR